MISLVALKEDLVCFEISSSPMGALKGLVTAFTTRLPKDYKNTVILTFHIGKLRPSNLREVLIPLAIFTKVVENEIMKEVTSN